jgi:hypothetical protein
MRKLYIAIGIIFVLVIASNVQLLGKQDNPGQGRKKSGDIYAYDSGSPQQYLGVVTGGEFGWPSVYVPQLSRFIRFDGDGQVASSLLLFGSTDCSGDPYTIYHNSYLVHRAGELYYVGEMLVPPISMAPRSYSTDPLDPAQCTEITSPYPADFRYFPLQVLAEGNIPINLPITLPFDFRTE